jgi:hypothetical protein
VFLLDTFVSSDAAVAAVLWVFIITVLGSIPAWYLAMTFDWFGLGTSGPSNCGVCMRSIGSPGRPGSCSHSRY